MTGAVPSGSARPSSIAAATAVAGASLTVIVGHDGSPGWQVARALGVAVLAAGAVAAEGACGDRGRGRVAALVGVTVLAVGAGFTPFLVKEAASLEVVAGATALGAGIFLAASGTVVGTRRRGRLRRIGAGVGTVLAALLVTDVVAPAVAAVNVPRPAVGADPASRGLAFETVALRTADGVTLAGWYVPSGNGAAVVVLHGAGSTRSDVLGPAAVLARNGFGVLMIDARGHGRSGGRAMDFGWYGDRDIAAATAYLAGRPDVDRRRLGLVGLSMGGEEAIGATATDPLVRAVVAEGAKARNAADEAWLSDEFGLRGFVQEQLERLQDRVADVLTAAPVPRALRAAVETSGTRYLLITAGTIADEGHVAAYLAAGAPDRVETWNVPGAAHTGGLRTAPRAWEDRVTAFLTTALGLPAARV
ncbi:MAG TPA: alpha/beta fold hydrolase [Acidimicrobiia bacterium]|nr:alpha/beta fold hydrolase [Acidimicrobiia bacterium]